MASQGIVSMIARQHPAQTGEGRLGNGRPFYQNAESYYGIRILLPWFFSGGRARRGRAATKGLGTSGAGPGRTPFGPASRRLALQRHPEILVMTRLFCVFQRQFGARSVGHFAPHFQFNVNGIFSGCCQLRQERKLVFAALVFKNFSASLRMSLVTLCRHAIGTVCRPAASLTCRPASHRSRWPRYGSGPTLATNQSVTYCSYQGGNEASHL